MFKSLRSPLSPAHFAFMRAVVQGLDRVSSWQRYLGQDGQAGDSGAVHAAIERLRLEFALAARRARRPGLARLVLIDAARVREHARTVAPADAAVPDLATFAAEHGLEEFSYAEQVAAFEERYGSTRAEPRRSRRAHLVARQLEALRWLEQQSDVAPTEGDLLSDWLAPGPCAALAHVGLQTVGDLVLWIRERGATWMRPLKSIGPVKAARLAAWLRRHGHGDELTPLPDTIGPDAHKPGRPQRPRRGAGMAWCSPANPGTAVRPLELYLAPAGVPGAAADIDWAVAWVTRHGGLHGLDGADKVQVTAYGSPLQSGSAEDPAAARSLEAPLASAVALAQTRLTATQRSYRREVERLLLWSHLVLGRSLRTLQPADALRYLDFLAHPDPHRRWCGPRGGQRWSACWRPFEGALSSTAQRQALAVLRSFFQWWQAQGQVQINPWRAVAALTDVRKPRPQGTAASKDAKTPAPDESSTASFASLDASPWSRRPLRELRARVCEALLRSRGRGYLRIARLRWCDIPELPEQMLRMPMLAAYHAALSARFGASAVQPARPVWAKLPQVVTQAPGARQTVADSLSHATASAVSEDLRRWRSASGVR